MARPARALLLLAAVAAAAAQPTNSNQGLPVSANPTALAGQRIAVLGMNYTQQIFNWSDTDLLNFKINGECLEANFDACAVYGRPLHPKLRSDEPDPPVPIGCRKANLTDPTVIAWAAELSHSEAGHMRSLREAVYDAGVTPITCPTVDYENGFTEFFNNALNRTGAERVKWDPFQDDLHFLISAEMLENAGVQADLGLALFFKDPLYVALLGGLTGGAAQFTAIDRTLIMPHFNDTLPEYNMTVKAFMDAVSSYRDALDGPVSTDQPYIFAGSSNLASTDFNGVLPARLPQQWISIVQCGGPAGGCFFPNGMEGPINTTQPLQIPTIPQALIDKNNEPIAVVFEPWGADPFKNDTPPYLAGYNAVRPPGQPYNATENLPLPRPFQYPNASERSQPVFKNPSLGAVANFPGVPAAPMTAPGSIPAPAGAGEGAPAPGAGAAGVSGAPGAAPATAVNGPATAALPRRAGPQEPAAAAAPGQPPAAAQPAANEAAAAPSQAAAAAQPAANEAAAAPGQAAAAAQPAANEAAAAPGQAAAAAQPAAPAPAPPAQPATAG